MPQDKTHRMESSKELEDALSHANTAGDLREALLSTLQRQGVRVGMREPRDTGRLCGRRRSRKIPITHTASRSRSSSGGASALPPNR
jgi:hypothetical protein